MSYQFKKSYLIPLFFNCYLLKQAKAGDTMNHSRIVSYMNMAHFIDHYAMLIFAAAVIVIAPTFGMTYGELLPTQHLDL